MEIFEELVPVQNGIEAKLSCFNKVLTCYRSQCDFANHENEFDWTKIVTEPSSLDEKHAIVFRLCSL
jgi:hypothetical protein